MDKSKMTRQERRQRRSRPSPVQPLGLTGAQRRQLWARQAHAELVDRISASGLNDGRPRTAKQWHCLLLKAGQ